MNTHPLAALIPAMSDDEYARLRDDIAANGLIDPITLYEDQVLDGRHRLRACEDAGVNPRFTHYDGESPAQFVISHNLHRRHLTTGQRTMIALDFMPHLHAEAKGPGRQGTRHDLTSVSADTEVPRHRSRASKEAGELVGVSSGTVDRGKRVAKERPDLAEKLRAGEMTVMAAHDQVRDAKQTNGASPTKAPPGRKKKPEYNGPLEGRTLTFANAAKRRVEKLVGMCQALDRGLVDLRVELAARVATDTELNDWRSEISAAHKALRDFERRIPTASPEETCNGH